MKNDKEQVTSPDVRAKLKKLPSEVRAKDKTIEELKLKLIKF